ncbi:hypothetical protein [Aliiroseovarius crassostreae]|uniref:hypothetical protein n=1 Tax=Aliiroseovarius crassostreae TaxID=154981 RepID=UPI00220F4A7D|nr:hypothetical protein [Aliiroseovarius crassostreae]UWP89793.1 hypothetical protein K3J57_03620 [Aliiroseovarius crassostreae]
MDLQSETARLARLMEERLDVSGADFPTKVRRAGRLLPRHVRAAAARLMEAQTLSEHPRLARQLAPDDLTRAVHEIDHYLRGVDPWERRFGIFISWASGLAFSLLLLVGAVLGLLYLFRGF